MDMTGLPMIVIRPPEPAPKPGKPSLPMLVKPAPVPRDWLDVASTTNLTALLHFIAHQHEVSVAEIIGQARFLETARARHDFCYRASQAGFGPSEIGRMIHRHHSSVIHAVRKVTAAMGRVAE